VEDLTEDDLDYWDDEEEAELASARGEPAAQDVNAQFEAYLK
jgi:hypothetical protein